MPSPVRLIRSPALSDITEYACAATASRESRLVFLAGACPLAPDGTTLGAGDPAGQATASIGNLELALAAAGATLTDVISTRILVASNQQKDLVAAWEVIRDAFGDHDVPSTLMGVTVRGSTDRLVEIEAVAALMD